MRPLRASSTIASLTLGAALLLGACGSSTGSTASDTSSTTATTSAPATTTTSAAAASDHCRSEDLRGSLGPTDAGAGQRYTVLVLTNTGTRTCRLRGFPGVSLLDASGSQLGEAAGREGPAGPSISLAPGEEASAVLHTSSAGIGGACTPTSTRIRVYPPDTTIPLDIPAAYTACGTFQVSTLVAGGEGR